MSDAYGQNMIQKNWQNSLEDVRRKEIIRQFLVHFKKLYGDDRKGFRELMEIFADFYIKRAPLTEVLDQIRNHMDDKIELNYYFDFFLPENYRYNIVSALLRRQNQQLAKIVSHKIKNKAPQIRSLLTKFKDKEITARELTEEARQTTDDDDIFFGVINFIKAEEEVRLRKKQLQRYGYNKTYNSIRKRTERFFYDDVAWRELRYTVELLQQEEKSFTKSEILFFYKIKSCLDEMTRTEQNELPPDSNHSPMGYFEELAGVIKIYNMGIISFNQLMELLSNTLQQFDSSIKEHLRSILSPRELTRRNQVCKPLCETNLPPQNIIRLTQSYLMIPEEYPITICSGKDSLGNSVLNERYVSIPSGSEHFSFKHMRKNVFEDSLFKAEDEQFELDMEIGNLEQTKEYLKGLYVYYKKQIIRNPDKEIEFKQFDQLRVRTLKKIYGNELKKVIKLMQYNPPQVLKVLIERVRDVLRELNGRKEEKKKEWRQTYEKNFMKSLDHRSFYFKQNEKKNVNHKNFVQELRQRRDLVLEKHKRQTLQNIKLGGSGESNFFSSFCFNEFPPTVDIVKKEPQEQSKQLILEMQQSEEYLVPQYRFLWNETDILKTAFNLIKYSLLNGTSSSEVTRQCCSWLCKIEKHFLKMEPAKSYSVYNPEDSQKYIDPKLKLPNSNVGTLLEPCLNQKLLKEPFETENLVEEEFPAFCRGLDSMNLTQYTPTLEMQHRKIEKLRDHYSKLSLHFLPHYRADSDMSLFYGSTMMYSIMRFIYTIYDRLLVAKDLVSKRVEHELIDRVYIQKQYREYFSDEDVEFIKTQLFTRFVIGVEMFLRNISSIEVSKYEQFCRNLLGSQAYLLFGIEKLIANTVRQLQLLVNNKNEEQLMEVYFDANALVNGANFDQLYFSMVLPYLVTLENEEPVRFTHNPREMVLSVNLLSDKDLSARTHTIQQLNAKLQNFAFGDKFSTFSIRFDNLFVEPPNLEEEDPEDECIIQRNGIVQKVVTEELEIVHEPYTSDMFYRVRKMKPSIEFKSAFQKSTEFRAKIEDFINN